MEHSRPAAFTDGGRNFCTVMTLVEVTGTYMEGCACAAHIPCGRWGTNKQTRMHRRTQTVISLLRFLITVTMGGPPVRIYLSPLLPPILLSPLPPFPPPAPLLLPGSRATKGPSSPLASLRRQDKRNFSCRENIWPPPHTKQTLYITVDGERGEGRL